ncbi:MAG TPA: hypothetical protein VHF58_01360 [Solirubrobacterales bacterium]|nr:hypothetical protein [Solirubrobacterales bacterium]
MSRLSKVRPSPALVVALAALVTAMSGAAIALPGKNSVTKNDIRKNAVRSKAIATGAVKSKDVARGAIGSKQIKGKSIRGNRLKDKAIKAKQIADDAISSQQVVADGLNSSDIADYEVVGPVRVAATDHATEEAGRADSPLVPLFTKGQLAIEAKCFSDADTGALRGEIYIRTSADRAIVTSHGAVLPGGNPEDFLNVDTPLAERRIHQENIGSDTADYQTAAPDSTFAATSADGKQLLGHTSIALKHGTLPGGDGPYGAGNVCLFGLQVSG